MMMHPTILEDKTSPSISTILPKNFAMTTIQFHVLLLIFLLTPAPLFATGTLVQSSSPVAKTNCIDRCGNVSIPYPFGTTKECYWNYVFFVTCNQTFDPPKLFMQNTTIEILGISLDGQVTLMQFIAFDCYYKDGNWSTRNNPSIELPYLMTVNNTANKFTLLGCDTYGYISGRRKRGNRDYLTGCTTTCDGMEDLVDGSCEGLGCCQITGIPKDVWRVELKLHSFNNHTAVWDFNDCSYGFLVEQNSFTFSRENLTNLRNVTKLPMVADWAIRNTTCVKAQMNSSDYACEGPNSECYEPEKGYNKYRCRCKTGYQGNPYLPGGCQDINECDFPAVSKCTYNDMCENFVGSYKCHCPKGYLGDGVGEGGCTRRLLWQSQNSQLTAGFALGIILVMLVICLAYLLLSRRRSNQRKNMLFLQNGGMILQDKLRAAGRREMNPDDNHMAKIFSSSELKDATNNFHKSMVIGQGGFGTVYKGMLRNKSHAVAIKKSKEVDPEQIEQFINEFMVLSQISHRNVVRLLGCCLETEVPLLVYEFVNNGTLYEHIHNQGKKCHLDWNLRLKIAIETADVLSYLHSAAATPIIHRDVKSANILLDHEFRARVSDFGASRLVPMDQAQLPTMVLGTLGYLDPEYMQTHQLTDKSDVYSFGVVLVELITGKKVINYGGPEEEKSLSSFFLSKLKQGLLFAVVDETFELNENQEQQVIGVAKLAQVCLSVRGEDRPSMKEVAMELESLKSGGRRSWAKQEDNAEEILPLSDKGCDVNSFSGKGFDGILEVDGDSTSMSYDSLIDHNKLSDGR